MKWLNLLLAFLFGSFAYVQLNDPDPWRWLTMYAVVTVLFLLAFLGRYFLVLINIVLIVSILWMLSLLPDFITWLQHGATSIVQSMKAEQPEIELTREFLGLVLVIIAMLYLRRQARRINPHIGIFS